LIIVIGYKVNNNSNNHNHNDNDICIIMIIKFIDDKSVIKF